MPNKLETMGSISHPKTERRGGDGKRKAEREGKRKKKKERGSKAGEIGSKL